MGHAYVRLPRIMLPHDAQLDAHRRMHGLQRGQHDADGVELHEGGRSVPAGVRREHAVHVQGRGVDTHHARERYRVQVQGGCEVVVRQSLRTELVAQVEGRRDHPHRRGPRMGGAGGVRRPAEHPDAVDGGTDVVESRRQALRR